MSQKYILFTNRNGIESTTELTALAEEWYVPHLSKNSQLLNVIDELLSPAVVIRSDLTVSQFIDVILAYINQSLMYNSNPNAIENGIQVRDAIVVPNRIESYKKENLKYSTDIGINSSTVTTNYVVEIVDGKLPYGLELKKVDGQYTIEGYAVRSSITTDMDTALIKEQERLDETLLDYLNRQLRFKEVEYVDGPNSDVVISDPPNTLSVGDYISNPVTGQLREIKQLVEHPDINITINEFNDSDDVSFDFEDGSLLFDNDGSPYEDLSWYGYLNASNNIYLRYKRVMHVLPENLIGKDRKVHEFTLGFREESKTTYHDVKTFRIVVRNNLDKTRDITLEKDYGNVLTDSDFSDVPDQKTKVYWTPEPFKRTLPVYLNFRRSDDTSRLIRIDNYEIDFVTIDTEDDDKLPAENQFILYTKNVDHHQAIRSDILLSFG